MSHFNPIRITTLTDSQFYKLEKKYDNIDKIDLIMYLNECGFYKSINEALHHFKKTYRRNKI